ncbi:uncharacterized protein FOMMEDRAFT_153539 [Fomitiporia mediterranea MF3/22]|uniref:uncharacterized protein n=1 Tax=Fomitiporia mediterranea (strain MF3/22) TaxID=694068 RepID=UPI0004407A09|nr:uncharacterized protein FOMMEDRAFT_153539 [Fomitiporia mediterranea MF3/22]EJD06150.1 hypothetical protein FOMMEDRAFT_153539 [Fomitiporia mediterranea MF3/22]
MTWEDDYRRGCMFFEQREYEAALKSINKAARENRKNGATFYLRSLVLEQLNRHPESLRDVQKAINLMTESESWKAYRHYAALLSKMGRLEESLKMVDMAPERADENDKKDAILVDLRERIMEALEPRPCHFSKLPVEMSTEIFTLVVDGDNANMLALSLVCRAWRDIVIGSSRFWRNLVLTPKTRLKQADTWLQRSGGGTLTTLHITGGFSFSTRPGMLRRANPDVWSRLETLKISSQNSLGFSSLPPKVVGQLQLVNLKLVVDKLDNVTWMALGKMNKSRLQRFMLHADDSEVMPSIDFFCTSLTTLKLCLPITAKNTLLILKGTPMLESLVLTSSTIPYDLGQIDPVELTYLRRLRLNHFGYSNKYLQYIRIPNVTALTIIYSRGRLVIPQYVTKLEYLHLSYCDLSVADFVTLLRTSTSLKTLEIPWCRFRDGDENDVLEALARPLPTEEKQGTSRMICCPQLQAVNLSGLRRLKADPVVLLVRTHLHGIVSPHNKLELTSSSEDPPIKLRRILTLVLDDCLPFDPPTLFCLEETVPHFRYKARSI